MHTYLQEKTLSYNETLYKNLWKWHDLPSLLFIVNCTGLCLDCTDDRRWYITKKTTYIMKRPHRKYSWCQWDNRPDLYRSVETSSEAGEEHKETKSPYLILQPPVLSLNWSLIKKERKKVELEKNKMMSTLPILFCHHQYYHLFDTKLT